MQNAALDSVVAVPLSSRAPEIPPLRIKVRASGLKTVGYAVAPGIRQLKKSRIVDAAGSLKEADLETLDEAIRAYLSDQGCALRFIGIAPSESLGCNKDWVAFETDAGGDSHAPGTLV